MWSNSSKFFSQFLLFDRKQVLYIGTFLFKERLQELWMLYLEKDMFMPALWHDPHCPMPRGSFLPQMASGHSLHCGFLYSDLFLIASSEMEPFSDQSIRKVLSLFQFCYLLSGMAEWLTALGIDPVPFARREWCFLPKEAASGCASLLNSSK